MFMYSSDTPPKVSLFRRNDGGQMILGAMPAVA
jgi:hypothetical protein